MKGYFEVQIKERHIKNLCCPACQMPEDVESEEAENHLQFLHNFVSVKYVFVKYPTVHQKFTSEKSP